MLGMWYKTSTIVIAIVRAVNQAKFILPTLLLADLTGVGMSIILQHS